MIIKSKVKQTGVQLSIRQSIIGVDAAVPLLDGREQQYVYFDNAASTPMLRPVMEAINAFMPWYSSVHRGSGFKSQLATKVFDDSRQVVSDFFGANPDDHVVIFGKNTTEAINKLANRLNLTKNDVVLVGHSEHHSNDLPWRKVAEVHRIKTDNTGALDFAHMDELIARHRARLRLVAISGASNVTGMMPDIHAAAEKAHSAGAEIFVDCAQLAAHRPIRMLGLKDPKHLDYIAVSAHKMYAPLGTGALVGRRDTFGNGDPDSCGGGTVKVVTADKVVWADLPDREEAGSPNIVGALALAKSLRELSKIGMNVIAAHEKELTCHALAKMSEIPGIEIYGDTDASNRVGVVAFNLKGIPHGLVAAVLGTEWGIGVRDGCFCAHPFVTSLLDLPSAEFDRFEREAERGDRSHLPGMVRVSFGLYNTAEEVDYLAKALMAISSGEYSKDYRQNPKTGEFVHTSWKPNLEDYFKL